MSTEGSSHSLPADDHTPWSTDADAPFASPAGDPWDVEIDDPFSDPMSADAFSAEIANVHASDWDFDAARIWGDEASPDFPA